MPFLHQWRRSCVSASLCAINRMINLIDFLVWNHCLYFWEKSPLFIVYNPFKILLSSLCILLIFFIYVHKVYWSITFFSCDSFIWHQGDVVFIELESVPPLLFFWKSSEKIEVKFPLNVYVELTNDEILSSNFFFGRFFITSSIFCNGSVHIFLFCLKSV